MPVVNKSMSKVEKKQSSSNLNRSKTTLMSSKQQEAEDATLISGATGNLFTLKKQQLKSYLAHFIGKQKGKAIFEELKYCVNLIMNIKDSINFIETFAKIKMASDLEKDIRLYLHTYFDCEFTIMMKIKGKSRQDHNEKQLITA